MGGLAILGLQMFEKKVSTRPSSPENFGERCCLPWSSMLLLVGLLALSVRIYYVTHVVVFQPANMPNAHGDAAQYYNYARNLIEHHVFSADPPSAFLPVGDSFRDPGYPAFLAIWMTIFPQWDSWYAAILLSQAVLGSLTVMLWVSVGRHVMPTPWLIAAGVIMAIWPHSVTSSSDIMSETLYGFLVAFALFIFCVAQQRESVAWALASGLCFTMAALTNAVLLPFAALVVLYAVLRRRINGRVAFVLVATVLALTIPWAIRNNMQRTDQPSSSDRAIMNFVQGSWPIYHDANKASLIMQDAGATRALNQINSEISVMEHDHRAGLSMIGQRMALAPGSYALWYLGKPALLWDWNLRIAAGDIYFHVTYHSPFEVNPLWRSIAALCHTCNRLLMLLCLLGCVLALDRNALSLEAANTALLLVFITLVHSVLQAEPRYSTPYRGAEILLGVFAVSLLTKKFASIRKR